VSCQITSNEAQNPAQGFNRNPRNKVGLTIVLADLAWFWKGMVWFINDTAASGTHLTPSRFADSHKLIVPR
jgi:hypothetical protein